MSTKCEQDWGYEQRDVTNALKRFFLIGQFVKFFPLIGPSKHLLDHSLGNRKYICLSCSVRPGSNLDGKAKANQNSRKDRSRMYRLLLLLLLA